MHRTDSQRPQLTIEQAAYFDYKSVLEYTGKIGAEILDPWDPEADGFMSGPVAIEPQYCVHKEEIENNATEFNSIQAAIDFAIFNALKHNDTQRIYVKIDAGDYNELVYLPKLIIDNVSVPITLYADAPDKTQIVANIDAQMPASEYTAKFAAHFANSHPLVQQMFRDISQIPGIISTFNASVLRVANDGFQIKNIKLTNSYQCDRHSPNASADEMHKNSQGQFITGQHQAVALLVAGADKVHALNVHLSSYQDTLFLREPAPFVTSRSYFKNCYIEGDIDFIFGQTTGFFSGCEICSRGSRSEMTYMSAPSTNIAAKYGLVFDRCDFTHDNSDNAKKGTFSLARQWFEFVRCTPYGTSPITDYTCEIDDISDFSEPPRGTISRKTLFSVGKCVILNSRIAAHINFAAPWSEWCGGQFSTAGRYQEAPWHPRYRPVQYSPKDMMFHLQDWPDVTTLELDKLDTDDPWIAEFNNTDVR